MLNYSLGVHAMIKRYPLAPKSTDWPIMARMSAGSVTDVAWVSLSKDTRQMVALRVYLALKSRGGS